MHRKLKKIILSGSLFVSLNLPADSLEQTIITSKNPNNFCISHFNPQNSPVNKFSIVCTDINQNIIYSYEEKEIERIIKTYDLKQDTNSDGIIDHHQFGSKLFDQKTIITETTQADTLTPTTFTYEVETSFDFSSNAYINN